MKDKGILLHNKNNIIIQQKNRFRDWAKAQFTKSTFINCADEKIIFEKIDKFLDSFSDYQVHLASYLGMENELDTKNWLEKTAENRTNTSFYIPKILSKVKDGADMEFFQLDFKRPSTIESSTSANSWGILEPIDTDASNGLLNTLLHLPKNNYKPYIVVLLLPGLLFDTKGARLGYGGGYYDRYIARLKRIQEQDQSFSLQLVVPCRDWQVIEDDLPVDPYDQKVNLIITNTRTIEII